METNYTNRELAEIIFGLDDDNFYEVMVELAKLSGYCDSIEHFTGWLHDVLYEIYFAKKGLYD